MKLLFDANLSPKLVRRITELFPGSTHVFQTGLAAHTSDLMIWNSARGAGFTIVTADVDFLRIAATLGTPPYVVRLENCDYRTPQVEALLRRHTILIAELEHATSGMLIIRHSG